ncbi:MAG: DUF4878 domain-containing protein [Bacteroidales bacterium]|nr:DUF4878 domain-containing protein [Bacteroidales bacterium]
MKSKIFIVALIGICSLMQGCGNVEEKKEMGPEATVEAFNRAITAGDFATAHSLCDTVSMKGYLDSYIEAWETLQREDSSALAIASSLLSGAVLEISKVEKDGEGKAVYYTLETEGHRKERKATVKKEEGEWKVQEITDAI